MAQSWAQEMDTSNPSGSNATNDANVENVTNAENVENAENGTTVNERELTPREKKLLRFFKGRIRGIQQDILDVESEVVEMLTDPEKDIPDAEEKDEMAMDTDPEIIEIERPQCERSTSAREVKPVESNIRVLTSAQMNTCSTNETTRVPSDVSRVCASAAEIRVLSPSPPPLATAPRPPPGILTRPMNRPSEVNANVRANVNANSAPNVRFVSASASPASCSSSGANVVFMPPPPPAFAQQVELPKLMNFGMKLTNDTVYRLWLDKLQRELFLRDLQWTTNLEARPPPNLSEYEVERMRQCVMSFIIRNVDEAHHAYLQHETDPAIAIGMLNDMHRPVTWSTLHSTRNEFSDLKFTKNDTVLDFRSRFQHLVQELRRLGEKDMITESSQLHVLTKNIDEFFHNVVDRVVARPEPPSVNEVFTWMKEEETRRDGAIRSRESGSKKTYANVTKEDENTNEHANAATDRRKKKRDLSDANCYRCGDKGHMADTCPHPVGVKKCYECGAFTSSHTAPTCPARLKKEAAQRKVQPKETKPSKSKEPLKKGRTAFRTRAKHVKRVNKYREARGLSAFEYWEDDDATHWSGSDDRFLYVDTENEKEFDAIVYQLEKESSSEDETAMRVDDRWD